VGLISQQAGVRISFFGWMKFAVPLVVVMFGVLFGLLYLLHRPGRLELGALREFLKAERRQLGRMNPGERNAALAFLVAVALWISPGVVGILAGADSRAFRWFDEHLPESVVALLAAGLLFLLPVDWKKRRFTMDWGQAARIDWGTILLFGGGLSLGDLMFKTGLADVLGRGLVTSLSLSTMWGLTAVATALGIVVSELTSNTASANMVIPVMIAMAKAIQVNPVPPAIAACLGASYGFMLPISTPPNAIVYGSGMVPITRMLRAGIFFDILGFIVIWLGLRLLLPLLGMG
jgi:sodium-dependent dicarboxylate transporter 2/3/5